MYGTLIAVAWAVVGAAAGWAVLAISERLAAMEELEPGRRGWPVYSPPALVAVLFGVFAYRYAPDLPTLGVRSLFIIVLVQVIFFDLEYRLILDRVMFPSIALALVVSLFRQPWWAGVATGLVVGLVFVLMGVAGAALAKTDALGFGDVKLAVFIGLLLGPLPTVAALLLGFFSAGAAAIGVAIWQRSLKGSIALGPYLALGALVGLYFLP